MRQVPIFWISLFDQICITISFPLLTFICFDKQSSIFSPATTHAIRSLWYGVFWGLPHFVAIMSAPILAILSDKYGRKKLMIVGALGALGFSIFIGIGVINGSILFILLGSLICGLCVRTEPIALASVADHSHENNKLTNMGALQIFISIGAFIGPIICGYFAKKYFFAELNFALPCLIGAVFGILTVLITCIFFKESNNGKTEKLEVLVKIKNFYKNPVIKNIFLLLIFSQIGWRLYYQYIMPILKIEYHFTNYSIGFFTGLIAIWLIVGSSIGIKLLDKYFAPPKMITFSLFFMFYGLVSVLLLPLTNNHFLVNAIIWSSSVTIAIGDVILYCIICTLLSNAVDKKEQGAIMGISFIMISIVWSLAGFLGGLLEAVSIYLPIVFAAISMGLFLLRGLYMLL
ncbi:MAG: MFS transporter [Gammaproteobacteria bacterium]|nr:MFS transporter [Gammaproteobacteria bacterium]